MNYVDKQVKWFIIPLFLPLIFQLIELPHFSSFLVYVVFECSLRPIHPQNPNPILTLCNPILINPNPILTDLKLILEAFKKAKPDRIRSKSDSDFVGEKSPIGCRIKS